MVNLRNIICPYFSYPTSSCCWLYQSIEYIRIYISKVSLLFHHIFEYFRDLPGFMVTHRTFKEKELVSTPSSFIPCPHIYVTSYTRQLIHGRRWMTNDISLLNDCTWSCGLININRRGIFLRPVQGVNLWHQSRTASVSRHGWTLLWRKLLLRGMCLCICGYCYCYIIDVIWSDLNGVMMMMLWRWWYNVSQSNINLWWWNYCHILIPTPTFMIPPLSSPLLYYHHINNPRHQHQSHHMAHQAKEYGYCDRRSGTCFCNMGYEGVDCSACTPNYFLVGSLCYPKKLWWVI